VFEPVAGSPNGAERPDRGDAITRLIEWATASGRRLPWRTVTDRYRLGVAEVLLQKTKAEAALPVWSLLLKQFPTPAHLERATDSEVIAVVGRLGLGHQRAVRLRQIASWASGRESSPSGVGAYGQAILALSSGAPPQRPPVDGNIARVITRVFGLSFDRGEPRKKPAVASAVRNLLRDRPIGEQLRVVYALVDLGALVCLPSVPRCSACPLSTVCLSSQDSSEIPRAFATGGATASDTMRN